MKAIALAQLISLVFEGQLNAAVQNVAELLAFMLNRTAAAATRFNIVDVAG